MIQKIIDALRYDPTILFQKVGLSDLSDGMVFRNVDNRYFKKSGMSEIFSRLENLDQNKDYNLFISGHKTRDINFLHKKVIKKTPRNILEFGCGVSTIAMASACKQISLSKGIKSKVYAIEADEKWADLTNRTIVELGLQDFATVKFSIPKLVNFNGQTASFFEHLPNIRPDLVYLDGPDPRSVIGDVNGLSMMGLEFIVQADLLLYEWSFYNGLEIIIDGRNNNYKFLLKNFRRKYQVWRNYFENRTVLKLRY